MIQFKIQLIVSSLILFSIYDGESNSLTCQEELSKLCDDDQNIDASKCLKHLYYDTVYASVKERNSQNYYKYLADSTTFENVKTIKKYCEDNYRFLDIKNCKNILNLYFRKSIFLRLIINEAKYIFNHAFYNTNIQNIKKILDLTMKQKINDEPSMTDDEITEIFNEAIKIANENNVQEGPKSIYLTMKQKISDERTLKKNEIIDKFLEPVNKIIEECETNIKKYEEQYEQNLKTNDEEFTKHLRLAKEKYVSEMNEYKEKYESYQINNNAIFKRMEEVRYNSNKISAIVTYLTALNRNDDKEKFITTFESQNEEYEQNLKTNDEEFTKHIRLAKVKCIQNINENLKIIHDYLEYIFDKKKFEGLNGYEWCEDANLPRKFC